MKPSWGTGLERSLKSQLLQKSEARPFRECQQSLLRQQIYFFISVWYHRRGTLGACDLERAMLGFGGMCTAVGNPNLMDCERYTPLELEPA